MVTDILSEFSFGIGGIRGVKSSIKAVQYSVLQYMIGQDSDNEYQQMNKEAIKSRCEYSANLGFDLAMCYFHAGTLSTHRK